MVGKGVSATNLTGVIEGDLVSLMSKLGDFPSAKIKLEDCFNEWINLESTRRTISDMLDDNCRDNNSSSNRNQSDRIVVSASMPQQPPRSPTKASPKKRSQEEMSEADASVSKSGDASMSAIPLKDSQGSGSVDLDASRLRSSVTFSGGDTVNDDSAAATRRHRANVDSIPIFYTPPVSPLDSNISGVDRNGKPHPTSGGLGKRLEDDALSKRLPEIEAFFKPYPQGIPIEKFVHVTKRLCNIPSFFNLPLCKRINQMFGDEGPNVGLKNVGNKTNRQAAIGSGTRIKMKAFVKYWQAEMEPYDKAERFFRLVKQTSNDCICKDDFIPYIQELLHFHPGLDFLHQHEEFQRKYALTVITRIFYRANRSRTGRLSLRELRHSNLMTEFMHVDEETDINKVTEYFSYEHFYVLYCRFFELDADKDSKLSPDDLLKYSEHALSEAIVDRIFQLGTRAFTDGFEGGFLSEEASPDSGEDGGGGGSSGMTYPDFIYFMLSEEDKTNENSLRYWFNCCDLDSNGVINVDEMRYFYRMQLTRLTNLGQESVLFQDVLCQMLDMLHPDDHHNLKLSDFLRPNKIQLSGTIFDVLFNLHKFLRFEGRDPFQEKQKREDPFNTDWDRFAFTEYHRLAAEEGYDNDADDNGITMDIDDNIIITDILNNGSGSVSYENDGDDDAYGQQISKDATDWYLDDDDEDEHGSGSSFKKTNTGKSRK